MLQDLECYFLGCWKSLLVGDFASEKDVVKLDCVTQQMIDEIVKYNRTVRDTQRLRVRRNRSILNYHHDEFRHGFYLHEYLYTLC